MDDLQPCALELVLSALDPVQLGRVQVVCKAWRSVARDERVVRACFQRKWGLEALQGAPRRPDFLHTATLASFVKRHHVVRGDSLQALAVRHGVDTSAIKRLNNLMTDHSLMCRQCIYIPITDPVQLRDRTVAVTYDTVAKRDVALVCEGAGDAGAPAAGSGRGAAASAALMAMQVEALRAKMVSALGRSLLIDDETARFYLTEAGGDLKAAMQHWREDQDWYGHSGGIVRVSHMQRWIEGGVGP